MKTKLVLLTEDQIELVMKLCDNYLTPKLVKDRYDHDSIHRVYPLLTNAEYINSVELNKKLQALI